MSEANGCKAFDKDGLIRGKLVHGHVYGGELAFDKKFYEHFRKVQ